MIDWAGSQKVDKDDIERMRQAGVEVVLYRPLHWYELDRLNHRTHRKLLVVDGRIGFTGGMGMADKWLGHAQDGITGATPSSESKGPWSRSSRPRSWTTGSRLGA